MSTLMIKDLSIATDLDAKAMSAVRGGTCHTAPSYGLPSYYQPSYGLPKTGLPTGDFKFDASQSLDQTQNVVNNNGNNVAFASGISSTVNPLQSGANTITL